MKRARAPRYSSIAAVNSSDFLIHADLRCGLVGRASRVAGHKRIVATLPLRAVGARRERARAHMRGETNTRAQCDIGCKLCLIHTFPVDPETQQKEVSNQPRADTPDFLRLSLRAEALSVAHVYRLTTPMITSLTTAARPLVHQQARQRVSAVSRPAASRRRASTTTCHVQVW